MTKRKIKLFSAIVCAALIAACGIAGLIIGLSSCNKDELAEISGAKDIILKFTDESYDFSAGVTAVCAGEQIEVETDSSRVEFGTPGEYDLIYRAGKTSLTVKVRIYGAPFITAPSAVQKYSDAVQWTVGVTAKDTFGKDLKVTAIPPETEVKGMPLYGHSYEVTVTATDEAGNTSTAVRTVAVSEEGRPQFARADITLTDVNTPIEVAGDYITALDENGCQVNAFARSADGKLCFSGDYFISHKGMQKFTLVTTEGYNDFIVTVREGDVFKAIEVGDITDYIYKTGEQIRFPRAKPAKGNAYSYEFEYEIEDKSGNKTDAEQFTAKEGSYIFRVNARVDGGEWNTCSEQRFFVRSETEIFDLALSPQNISFFSPNVAAGASLEFVPSVEIGGQTGPAYRFSMGTKNETTLDRVLQVDQRKLKKLIERGLTSISFEIGTTGYENGCVWVNAEFFGQYAAQGGNANYSWGSIGGGMVADGGWSKFTFDLAKGYTSPTQPAVYLTDASGNVIFNFQQCGLCFTAYSVYPTAYIEGAQNVYIRNIYFGRQSQSGGEVNTYRNGDRTVELGENGKAVVDGVNYTYETFTDGTVLFFGTGDVFEFAMNYTPSGNGKTFSSLLWNGTEYLGDFMFSDGDLLLLKNGSVSFDLPDFASAFKGEANFKYSLKKYGGSNSLADGPKNITLTSDGAYQWTASFYSDGKTVEYIYDFYVLKEDDFLSKVRVDDDTALRFAGMEEGEPVFMAESQTEGIILYFDGDLVQSMLDDNSIRALSLKMDVRKIGGQAHMMWDGGTTLTTAGYRIVLGGGSEWTTIDFDPCILREDGIVREDGKDLYVWFNVGRKLEFKGLSLTKKD